MTVKHDEHGPKPQSFRTSSAAVQSNETSRDRAQTVHIRRDHEVCAMSWDQRLRAQARNLFRRNDKSRPADQTSGDIEADPSSRGGRKQQFRLEATRRAQKRNVKDRLLSYCCGWNRLSSASGSGQTPNQKLAGYLHWMFRVNFVVLFTVMCVAFFALVIFFAGWITLAGKLDAKCVRVGSEAFGATGTEFADAFSLSWTTFSTVGYGSTYPALGYQNDHQSSCFFINFICSLEALVGVLYSGFCGAILFGKVLRIQSQAQVIFSDPLLVRYGSGVMVDLSDDNSDAGKIPCPVLEFRIINRLFSENGGEIMDATINVVANIDADDADPSQRQGLDPGQTNQYGNSETDSESGSMADSEPSGPSLSLRLRSNRNLLRMRSKGHQTIDEELSARLVSKHVFSKVPIEASDHPFFKRVWLARHILDENSPILRPRVRRQIRRNSGYWPDRLNNSSDVRESLRFNQILVSLNGVSNVSASDVYSQKIYDFVDVNVGYQFVNILYKDSDGGIGVDTDLINDVREQNGGGGESLILET